jgi:membrane protease YdiL (CAAX protease family)
VKAGLIGTALAIVVLAPMALALQAITFAPKLPPEIWLWAANNLLLVAFAEEALFRGFLQTYLTRLLSPYSWGGWLSIGIASIAFGFLHYAGGPQMVIFASIAGVAYGNAYREGGLLASVVAHFGFNLMHFLFFTYPLLMPR